MITYIFSDKKFKKLIREIPGMKQADIQKWVASNAGGLMPKILFTLDEIDHISMCMEHIYKWYYEDYPIGDFLTAVVRNDFCEACYHADDTNRKALYLYAIFLANKIPSDYRVKALGSFEENASEYCREMGWREPR